MSVKRFPFAIDYQIIANQQAKVVAVLDERQDPESISRRLAGEV